MAVGESGERLSHAVGCAFAICLEKKQQREKASPQNRKFSEEIIGILKIQYQWSEIGTKSTFLILLNKYSSDWYGTVLCHI
jgi:hypothetical protein